MMKMHTLVKQQLAPQPSLGDILSNFFTNAPLIDPGMHAYVVFARSVVFFILADVVTYMIIQLSTGKPLALTLSLVGAQAAYLALTALHQLLVVVPSSPTKTLLEVADTVGATMVTDLIKQQGQQLPDISSMPAYEPDIPPTE